MSAPVRIGGAAPLAAALADELLLASRMLGDLAYDLGSDETVLRRHVTGLQSIDRVTQMLLAVADLLRLPTTDEAVMLATVPLDEMAGRLRAAMTMAPCAPCLSDGPSP